MNTSIVLEIATFTYEGAIAAYEAGAHRIELCENPNDGGTTPSYGMLKRIIQEIPIPVFPIIRPRGGNFVYNDAELEIIKDDIRLSKELGYKGIVLGVLTSIGEVNSSIMKELVELSSPMEVTFHRAFDRTRNPFEALEKIIECGCKRILTSGQYPSLMNSLSLIKQLVIQSNDRIIIMPGSGLKSENVQQVLEVTNAKEIHTAARKAIFQESVFSPESMDEQMKYISVDAQEINKILATLNSIK